MSAPVPFLSATSERWKNLRERDRGCENLVELVSQSRDPDYAGIGSSPFLGDVSGPGVIVPQFATTNPQNRFLFRLCGVQIPSGFAINIRGLRQAVTLRALIEVGTEPDLVPYPIELEQTSPFWHFPDGNVSWHLMWQPDSIAPHRTTLDADTGVQLAGTSPTFQGYGAGSALLYRTYSSLVGTYTAPAQGRPLGAAVAHLGNLHDIRYPWENTDWSLDLSIMGPGAVIFYASVFQPDLEARTEGIQPAIPGCVGISPLRPEDQFLAAYPDALYGRVAGAMTVELFPCCGART